MKNKSDKKNQDKLKRIDWSEADKINTDPLGSYTGVNTEDKMEKPVQDADDL